MKLIQFTPLGTTPSAPLHSSVSLDNADATSHIDKCHVNPVAMGDGMALRNPHQSHERHVSGDRHSGQENGQWLVFGDGDDQSELGC